MAILLLVSVFVIATCGLVYELIAGTVASYLLGDSVTQFSTIIGAYLFAMGIGSWLSRYITRNLLATFIRIEILIGLVGGFSAALLFTLFEQVTSFRIPLYGLVGIIGTLVGIEIPLLLRILKDEYDFKDLVSKVFTFDYIGALLASILFPLVLVPMLGIIRSSFLFGIFNVAIALWLLYAFREEGSWVRWHRRSGILALIALVIGFIYSNRITAMTETAIYPDTVIYAESTPYQRIVLTRGPQDLRLFLNGNLQFSSRDEYRYHEALVHPGLAAVNDARKVLILGGGDGMAAREVLRYPNIERVTQVELDPAMVRLFSENSMLTQLNGDAFRSDRMEVIHADAFVWLRQQVEAAQPDRYDFIVVDFPDPSNFSIGKLYSLSFYRLLTQLLSPGGALVIQSTSPYVAPKSFWCVNETLRAAGLQTQPYHAFVPSFGDWGFVLASRHPLPLPAAYPNGLRFVSPETVAGLFTFPTDMRRVSTEVNRLDNQVLVQYFDDEWSAYGVN